MPTIEKIIPSGAYRVSDIIGTQCVSKVYYGYTKKEALQLFREEFKPRKIVTIPKRARPVCKGVCWCCCSWAWLYRFNTDYGQKLNCAKCCNEFGCKAGFTRDGIKITHATA